MLLTTQSWVLGMHPGTSSVDPRHTGLSWHRANLLGQLEYTIQKVASSQ